MTSTNSKFGALTLALALSPVAANAAPEFSPVTGHFYEVYPAGADKSWNAAKVAAETLAFGGVQGHLATIQSLAEDQLIDSLRIATPGINTSGGFANSELWVGGYQAAGAAGAGDGWTWINNDGPIPGVNGSATYANWRTVSGTQVEPNDAGGSESHLAVGWSGQFVWNDEASLEGLHGYVVEYDYIPPIAAPDESEASSGVPKAIDVLANDAATDGVVTIESQPTAGDVLLQGASALVGDAPDYLVTFTSPSDFEGTATFVYRVTDANGAYATATVTVTVSASEATVEVGMDQLIFNQAQEPSPNSNNPMTAAYQQVLDGGDVTISCCRVLDTREGAGRKGAYKAAVFDLGKAVADTLTNPSCVGMPDIPQGKAVLRPWHRGVPLSRGIVDPGDPEPDTNEHDLGVCLIEADVKSRGVVFSAEEAKNVLGYRLNGAVETIRYRPFTGGVSIDPVEVDKAYVTPWTAEWDESRSGKRFSDNVMVVNLWHDWSLLPSVPYLLQLASSLDASIKQVRADGCVENNDGFLNGLQLQVKRAQLNMALAILPWLRASAGQAAVEHLNDATRQAMLMNVAPGYDPYGLCPGNPEGLFVGRMMSLKYATCSELLHPFSSASSLDGACMIEEDILCELPELPGFPHPASCTSP
jgi:hypothetical protein